MCGFGELTTGKGFGLSEKGRYNRTIENESRSFFMKTSRRQLLKSGRQEVRWEGREVSQLEGKPVQLRLAIRAAALYSLQFVS